jgi:glycosyltransferase involved in cell wall biosynthesis
MNILIISSERLHPQNTFASIFELSQAKAISKKNIKVKILSIYELNTFNLINALFKKVTKKYNDIANRLSYLALLKYLIFSLINNRTLIKYHKIQQVDVIEGIGVTSIYNLIFRYKFGITWTQHGIKVFKDLNNNHEKFNLIHAHSRFLKAGLLAREIKKTYNTPYLITEHSSFLFKNKIPRNIINRLNNVYEDASLIIAVSQTLINTINTKIKCSTKIVLIPNILDDKFEKIDINEKKEISNFKFVNVGSLLPIKNHKLLIDAFKLICNKNIDLTIVGNGPLLNELKQYSTNIPNIIFKGSVSNSEVLETLSNTHAFVLSSKNETFGVAIIEALACGLPVISTKSGGPEFIITKNNGLLVDNNNPISLSNAMLELIKNYDIYNPLEIRNECIKNFGTNTFTNRIIAIYNNMLQIV